MLNNIIYDKFMDFSIQFDTPVAPEQGVVMGFGVFDGVHPGHKLIVSSVREMASSCGALPGAVTFVPHPRAVLPGMEAPELIISVEERLKQLRLAGAQITGVPSRKATTWGWWATRAQGNPPSPTSSPVCTTWPAAPSPSTA